VKDTVIEFKNALDKINWSSMPFGFKSFPLGVCGDISDILAEHLYRSGYENITYVCGKNESGTHACGVDADHPSSPFNIKRS